MWRIKTITKHPPLILVGIDFQKPGIEDTSIAAGLTLIIWAVLGYGQKYLRESILQLEIVMLEGFTRVLTEPKPVTYITFGILLIVLQQAYAWKTRK